jgi:hypothetical protein
MRWPDAVKLLLEEKFEEYYERWEEAALLEDVEDYMNKMETAA